MGDIDQNQFQTETTHGVANETVAQQADAENRANHVQYNLVHIMNNKEWTENEKRRIIQINQEERERGKNFMRRIKERWDLEFPHKKRTAQNLIDNARRFENERITGKSNMEWNTDLKLELLQIDGEERKKGRGFMKRVKKRWDLKYPEYRLVSMQKLRDNASRFKKDPVIVNLMLVRERTEFDCPEEMELIQGEREELLVHETEDDVNLEENNTEEERDFTSDLQIKPEDKELEDIFLKQIENQKFSTLTEMEPRNKLHKLKLSKEIEESANRILYSYLSEEDNIPEVTDKVYAMGKAIENKMGVGFKRNETFKKRPTNGNRRERKLRKEMKELRQNISKASNEIYRRKVKRKATFKEKKLLKGFKKIMNDIEPTTVALKMYKEQWIDKLRYKRIKLIKMKEKGKRIMDNKLFESDQRNFFRKINENTEFEGEMPDISKFVEFWGGIWERDDKTPNMPWMKKVQEDLKEKITQVKEFNITEKELIMEIKKRKNWTAPGIDGIQNFWWKKFTSTHKVLTRIFNKFTDRNNLIPKWWPSGKTVLLPKSKDVSDEKNFRPITCLNTSYKFLTGLIAKYMKNHTIENDIWDKGQLGAAEGVLGTVDQLIIDRCIMEEVKIQHRNLAVAYYDYKKAYDKVHHDWMLRVYQWIGIPIKVIELLQKLMSKWKTRLEITYKGEKIKSRWIEIKCGFLQGDSYSPVGFCLSEIPVCKLLQETKGYRMGEPGNRKIKRTHSLFVDDLKVYQESHEILKDVNEMIVQASHDTGAMYGVEKCAEIVFERGKMVKGEGLQVLHERMKTMDPDKKEIYKFLGVEQADGLKTKEVFKRVKEEVTKRTQILTKTELNDNNLIKAINAKVIPVAAYPMNVCKFTKQEIAELDQVIKRELRSNNQLGRQSSDERLYLKRDIGGRGLKSLRDVYFETRLRVACYMSLSDDEWIKTAWRKEVLKENNSLKEEAVIVMQTAGRQIDFLENFIILDGNRIDQDWKTAWKLIKGSLKKGVEEKRKDMYKEKEMQSEIFRKQDAQCNLWLEQKLSPKKTASIISMLEQMVETKSWKFNRGLVENNKCRLCGEYKETVEHLLAGCKILANSDYLSRHNRALMVFAVAWSKEHKLLGEEVKWYEERWCRGHILENEDAKLSWDFEFNLRKTTTSRRPDLILEDKNTKSIWICDMACPQQNNIEMNRNEKQTKYRQLAFELRERRAGYKIKVTPIVIGALGGGVKETKRQINLIFDKDELSEKVVGEMQKTILMDSETLIRKVLSGLIQSNI